MLWGRLSAIMGWSESSQTTVAVVPFTNTSFADHEPRCIQDPERESTALGNWKQPGVPGTCYSGYAPIAPLKISKSRRVDNQSTNPHPLPPLLSSPSSAPSPRYRGPFHHCCSPHWTPTWHHVTSLDVPASNELLFFFSLTYLSSTENTCHHLRHARDVLRIWGPDKQRWAHVPIVIDYLCTYTQVSKIGTCFFQGVGPVASRPLGSEQTYCRKCTRRQWIQNLKSNTILALPHSQWFRTFVKWGAVWSAAWSSVETWSGSCIVAVSEKHLLLGPP